MKPRGPVVASTLLSSQSVSLGSSTAAYALGIAVACAACGDNVSPPLEVTPDAAPVGQGSEPRADIIITEVSPLGAGPDWIELKNRSSQELDLCGYFLTDSVDRLDHYAPLGGAAPPDPCEYAPLAAGAFIIINASDAAAPGAAPFRLGQADEVHIVDLSGRAIDSIVYLFAETGKTLSRLPTESGLFFPAEPSPGADNIGSAP